MPLVAGIASALRGSISTASRSARARPLNALSAMWWLFDAVQRLDVQRDPGGLREAVEPMLEHLGVHLAQPLLGESVFHTSTGRPEMSSATRVSVSSIGESASP